MTDPKDRYKTFNSGRANFFLVTIITCLLAAGALKIAAPVIIPFIIAVFLALVLQPLMVIPGKFRIPRFIPILLAVVFIVAGLFFMGAVLFSSARAILALYPKYEAKLTEIYRQVAQFFEFSYDEQLGFIENLWSQLGVRSRIRLLTLSLSNSFLSFLRDAVMVVLFVVFLLIEAAFLKEKIDVAFEGRHAGQIKKMSADIVMQISRYLSIKFVISLVTGVIVAALLKLVGLEFAVVWGIIQFILNFIPSLGSIACGVAASVFALVQFWPEPAPVILVVIIMLVTNITIGNVLEPKIMGDNLGLSPIVVLLSLMIWGFIWGFAGMILAVPMMVIIKIVCENVTLLEPVSILLGSRKAVLAKKAETEGSNSTFTPPVR
jgi:predicted PurR-regulated permease PerM